MREDRPRESKFGGKSPWLRYGLVVAVVVIAMAPLSAFAGDDFLDVPASNIFHADIAWMLDNGVTVGCGSGNYCPSDNVSREQMAAFMKRLSTRKIVDAATAVTAEHATTADSATTATSSDDSDTLDGLDSTAFAAATHTHARDQVTAVSGLDAISNTLADAKWYNMAGVHVDLDVPAGETALVVVRFAAESACDGGEYGSVRILLDGVEMAPAAGSNFAFDSSDGATETGDSWEAHAMERYWYGVGAGTHTIQGQWRSGCTIFRIDDWSLVAEAKLGVQTPVFVLTSDDEEEGRNN